MACVGWMLIKFFVTHEHLQIMPWKQSDDTSPNGSAVHNGTEAFGKQGSNGSTKPIKHTLSKSAHSGSGFFSGSFLSGNRYAYESGVVTR